MKRTNTYVVYDQETDNVLAKGSAWECASQMKMTIRSFYSMVSKVKRGVHTKYEVEIKNTNN